MKILVTICARKGSKRLENKNIKHLMGKPLIAHTIETAKKWEKADNIIVSTDSNEIANISKKYGAKVPFMRPDYLATDSAPKLPVIKHAIKYLMEEKNEIYDLIVDLDPTSPLRTVEDLDKAYDIMIGKKPKNLFSVCRARKNPYFNMVELNDEGYAHICKEIDFNLYRMQDAPEVYEMNASIYMFWTKDLLQMDGAIDTKSMIYEMPYERSIDIDSESDFKMVEYFMLNKSYSAFNKFK